MAVSGKLIGNKGLSLNVTFMKVVQAKKFGKSLNYPHLYPLYIFL